MPVIHLKEQSQEAPSEERFSETHGESIHSPTEAKTKPGEGEEAKKQAEEELGSDLKEPVIVRAPAETEPLVNVETTDPPVECSPHPEVSEPSREQSKHGKVTKGEALFSAQYFEPDSLKVHVIPCLLYTSDAADE